MDKIFDTYSVMVVSLREYTAKHSSSETGNTQAQTLDAIRSILPVATKVTVGIFGSSQALKSLIMHLKSDVLPEAQETGQKLHNELQKVSPLVYQSHDNESDTALMAYRTDTVKAVKSLADKHMPENYSAETKPVKLNSVWPRNEIDIIPDMLYGHSGLPLEQIQQEVETWSYNKKIDIFEAYIGERRDRGQRPGRALEKIHYSWDLICDYGVFRDMQRHRMVDDLEWQLLTPRYGYEIPKLVDEAGLSEQFELCFDLSLKLYSLLQAAGYEYEAQYATLLGHRMRWKVTYNARQAFHILELRTSPQSHPGCRTLAVQMHEKIAEVHPMLAAAMKFVKNG